MPKKPFEPNFKTPVEDQEKVESIKKNSLFVNREVKVQFNEFETDSISIDVEQLAKSYGIYLEFNRAKTGRERDWMYMIRIGIPGGGPINREQWQLFDELSEKHNLNPEGTSSLRFTTRQAVQFHWLDKKGVLDVIKTLAEKGLPSINGCGDNVRNVMCCPVSAHSNIFNAHILSEEIARYFRLPTDAYIKIFAIDPEYLREPEQSFKYGPQLLNRKFKIAVSAVMKDPNSGELIPDNCVEIRTNDVGISPIVENGKVENFQVYIGGGQGERNNYPTMATLGQPLCIVSRDNLMSTLDAIVSVHQEWGDRGNRHWARLKYLVKAQGIEWYRDQVSARLGSPLIKPNPDHDVGSRQLHHGWTQQEDNGKWTFGAFIENGRIVDGGPNGKLKTMMREIMNKYDTQLMVTANQDVLFTNLDESQKQEFENDLKSYGYGQRNGKPYSNLRLQSGACVGRDTCRLTYTDSEKMEPWLIDQLEELGWGDLAESIGITGCERQCFRPGTKSIGLVGTGLNRYMFKLFGSVEARHQGRPLISADGNELYLRTVLKEDLTTVFDFLFKDYKENAQDNEDLGTYHRRIGDEAIIKLLKDNESTSKLMEKPFNTFSILDLP